MADLRLALEKAKGILDRVDQGPVEVEQLSPRASGENNLDQAFSGQRVVARVPGEVRPR